MKNRIVKVVVIVFLVTVSIFSTDVYASEERTDTPTVYADSSIAINASNFPDQAFRDYLMQAYISGGDGMLSSAEIARITNLSLSNLGITDLKGIEHFTALTQLSCINNALTSLDVSALPNLTSLNCYGNQLVTLKIGNKANFVTLNCKDNELSSLNLSGTTSLQTLTCSNNQLVSLDVSMLPSLKTLLCSGNSLTSLVMDNPLLTTLNCSLNNLESLNISNTLALTELTCNSNKLVNIDVSKHTELEKLTCYSNKLTALNVSTNLALTRLSCGNNALTSLDVSNNLNLTELLANANYLTYYKGTPSLTSATMSNQQTHLLGVQQENTVLWRTDIKLNENVTFSDSRFSYDPITKQLVVSKAPRSATTNFTIADDAGLAAGESLRGTITVTSSQYYTPVTNIIETLTSTYAGIDTPLDGTVTPSTASVKNITWSVKDAGTTGATVNGNILTTKTPGTVTLTATVTDGTLAGDYTKDVSVSSNECASPVALICTYSGTKGDNDWYIDGVTVTPPIGYEISTTLGSGYTNEVIVNESNPIVYLKDTVTGDIYSGKQLLDIKIDTSAPTVSGIDNNGISNSMIDVEAIVSDDNLSKVVLYTADNSLELVDAIGAIQTINGTKSTVVLKTLTKDQYYRIEAIDYAGHATTYYYKVNAKPVMQPNYQILAQNARITTLQAKEIIDIQELKEYHQVNSNPVGKKNDIVGSCVDFDKIQAGVPGNYQVTYTLGKESITVELEVFIQEISNSSSKEETKRPAIKTNDTTKVSLYWTLVCVTSIGMLVIKKKKYF